MCVCCREVVDIECFLRATAEKEAEAKTRLQMFIEALLERADRAERQLLRLNAHADHNHYARRDDKYAYADPYAPSEVYTPGPGRGGRSLDDVMQGTVGNRVRSDRRMLTHRNDAEYISTMF